MNYINRHGLSRVIPEGVKRKIRQDAGFGCVMCGCGIFEYEHIEPVFIDATEHNPDHMTLLCPTCHGKVTKGILSKESLWTAKKKPAAIQNGFSNEWFDFSSKKKPYITFGGTKTTECQIPLEIYGIPIISIKNPLDDNTPFLLSAVFFNEKSQKTLEIIDNEWKASSKNWDFKFVGPRLTIYNQINEIVLQLKTDPPHGIIIEFLKMFYKGYSVIIKPDSLTINNNTFYGGMLTDSHVGISLN